MENNPIHASLWMCREKKQDYIQWWEGDKVFTKWCSPAEAQKIVSNPKARVKTWLKS